MRLIVQHAPLDGLAVSINHYSFAYVNVLNVLFVLASECALHIHRMLHSTGFALRGATGPRSTSAATSHSL